MVCFWFGIGSSCRCTYCFNFLVQVQLLLQQLPLPLVPLGELLSFMGIRRIKVDRLRHECDSTKGGTWSCITVMFI